MDLDHFKAVNDQHGHLSGSRLLVEVARVLRSCVRDEDVVVRYGGDEYVVLLVGIDSGGGLKVAERIRRAIEDHRFLSREGARVRVTASIGLASFPEHAGSKAEILDFADRAMYRGKRSTRNVVYMASKDLPPVPAGERGGETRTRGPSRGGRRNGRARVRHEPGSRRVSREPGGAERVSTRRAKKRRGHVSVAPLTTTAGFRPTTGT